MASDWRQRVQIAGPAARTRQDGLHRGLGRRLGRQLDHPRRHLRGVWGCRRRYLAHPVAVPVAVEHRAGLARDRPDAQHVEVVEVELGFQAHVLVADIAPAQERRAVVGNHLLVVHAPVQAFELGCAFGHAPHPVTLLPGIEDANLDIRMAVDARQQGIAQLGTGHVVQHGVEVVEQHADLDASVGRGNHARHQQLARGIAKPDVVLEIQRVGGAVDQHQAPLQPIGIALDQPKARCVGAMRRADGLLHGCEAAGALRRHGVFRWRLRPEGRCGTPASASTSASEAPIQVGGKYRDEDMDRILVSCCHRNGITAT